jgi:hypothetical protein
MINVRFQHKAAQFVWIVPTVILVYKIATFTDVFVLQGPLGGPLHQYFGTTFSVPEATNWREFWNIVSSPDMLRGRAQREFTAPFYAGIGYSLAALVSRHIRATTPVAENKEANAIVKSFTLPRTICSHKTRFLCKNSLHLSRSALALDHDLFRPWIECLRGDFRRRKRTRAFSIQAGGHACRGLQLSRRFCAD